MKTYNVSLDLVPRIALLLEIRANSEEEATEKAVESVLKDPAYRIMHPVNGDVVEVTGDDVSVDWAQEQPSTANPQIGPWTGKRIRTKITDMNEVELNAGAICPDCNGPRTSHTDDCFHWKCEREQIIEHACGMAEIHIPIGWMATVGEIMSHDRELGDMYDVVWDDNPNAANPDRSTTNMGVCIWGATELEKNAEVVE